MKTMTVGSPLLRLSILFLLACLYLPVYASKGNQATNNCPGAGSFTTSATGDVILDNTSTPGTAAVGANLIFYAGGSKTTTAICTGAGGNSISINDFQTLVRDTSVTPNDLLLYIGRDSSVVQDQKFGTNKAYNYFANGQHLFDLNRLRATADWLSEDLNHNGVPDNITPDADVPYGTYGTLTLPQFLDNIAKGRTMYGIVRVMVPLQKLAGNNGTAKNALGETVNANVLYGFCSNTTNGSCSCAPGTSNFSDLSPGRTLCGITMPSNAKIKVRGALFWDFVDNMSGKAIELRDLPYAPRDLYFMVQLPIMVNWAGDANDDGAMDNMPYISSLTSSITGTNPINITSTIGAIDFTKVTQESKDSYRFATGKTLTAADFALLNKPTQYHLLMPSGYETGWAAAFDKLNMTAATWAALPPNQCTGLGGVKCEHFGVPSGVTGIMTADDIRSGGFEDIPTYLYSGGLIDMHKNVNISGLIYVPQAMELEALGSAACSSMSTAPWSCGIPSSSELRTAPFRYSAPVPRLTVRRSPRSVGHRPPRGDRLSPPSTTAVAAVAVAAVRRPLHPGPPMAMSVSAAGAEAVEAAAEAAAAPRVLLDGWKSTLNSKPIRNETLSRYPDGVLSFEGCRKSAILLR